MITRNLVGTAVWMGVAGWLVADHVTPIRLLLLALGVLAFISALYAWATVEPEWQEEMKDV